MPTSPSTRGRRRATSRHLGVRPHGLGDLLADRNVGSSDVIGSWTIVAMRLPRSWRRLLGSAPISCSPSYRIEPSTSAAAGSSPSIAEATVDLPHPDSPTRPSTSELAHREGDVVTAETGPWSVAHRRRRRLEAPPATVGDRRGGIDLRHTAAAGDPPADPVADEVEGEHRDGDGEPGKISAHGARTSVVAPLVEHRAEARRRRLGPQSEERQGRLDLHREAHQDGGLHDHRSDRVGEDVADGDADVAPSRGRARRRRTGAWTRPAPTSARRGRGSGRRSRRWRSA